MSNNPTSTLYVKNMVCSRCITVVRQTLEELGLDVQDVELGKAIVKNNADMSRQKIDSELQKYGFKLIRGKSQQLIEQVKTLLIQYVKIIEEQEEDVDNLSDYLVNKLHQNYTSLSSSFSESEDITIEKYLIHLKIERVKELLSYDELILKEIAFKLNYSSVAHLSSQFKQITGLTPTDYKKTRDSFRTPLDEL